MKRAFTILLLAAGCLAPQPVWSAPTPTTAAPASRQTAITPAAAAPTKPAPAPTTEAQPAQALPTVETQPPATTAAPAQTQSLVKGGGMIAPGYATCLRDVARVQGVNNNPVVGYGLVVGLAGTGDSSNTTLNDMLISMLNSLGQPAPSKSSGSMKTKNAALVSVTAALPASSRDGDAVDVTVSSIGDASSLEGGTLVLAQLKAADGKVYVAAQGPLLIGSGNGKAGAKIARNVAMVANGGLVMRSLAPTLARQGTLTWVLKENDFGVATAVANAINRGFGMGCARALDNGNVEVSMSGLDSSSLVSVIARMEALPVEMPPAVPRIVINERTGTVVMGGQVMLRPVAIAHGSMRITVGATPATMPIPGVTGSGMSRTLVTAGGATVEELVRSLNALGVTPRDLITILQALKKASALQADIVTL